MPPMSIRLVTRVEGRAIPVPGHDIDTDRIMPARFLKAISFEGLEAHVFEDDRANARAQGTVHPFDDPAHQGAAVLIVNRNFGCGSSREHAPQALRRWGILAVVGESFSEIFFGNALAIGVPCVRVAPEAADWLIAQVQQRPGAPVVVDVAGLSCHVRRPRLPGLASQARTGSPDDRRLGRDRSAARRRGRRGSRGCTVAVCDRVLGD